MEFLLEANLPDAPGKLIEVLKPISDNSGNILSVIHSHEDKKKDKIPVMIKFSFPPLTSEEIKEKLSIIEKEMEKGAVEIIKISERIQREMVIVILSGHVFETDFVNTMKQINAIGANVVGAHAKFTEISSISNVKFEILCDKNNLDTLMKKLRSICKEKKLTLITDR